MQFLRILRSLLPQGAFWEIKTGSAFYQFLLALSDELERVRNAIYSIFDFISFQSNPSRFMRLLALKETSLATPLLQARAVAFIVRREGSLSRKYIEERLKSLGYSNFDIHDPTEDDLGLEPIIDPENIGIVTVKSQITKIKELRAGFKVGDPLVEWRDSAFESQVTALFPAHVVPRFLYRKKEDFNAESI